MDLRNEMKYFSALTFDNNTYNFAITPNGEISCAEFGITVPASIIELKPNFVLRRADGSTIYSLDDHIRTRNKKKSLICQWIIDEDVFEYLINNKKVMYSADMAVYYGFAEDYRKHAFDAYHNKNSYKRRTKRRIQAFEARKAGKFN